jgi:hypothetical protein
MSKVYIVIREINAIDLAEVEHVCVTPELARSKVEAKLTPVWQERPDLCGHEVIAHWYQPTSGDSWWIEEHDLLES